jgi:hypothetical protein
VRGATDIPVNVLTCPFFSDSLYSFGGGSEMMRDGDVIGIIHTLARAQRYDCDLQSRWLGSCKLISFNLLPCHHRIGAFMGHVPWLGEIILSYPESLPDYQKIHTYAQERAMRRIKEGSPYKDLFHYLVCYLLLADNEILMHKSLAR